MIDKLRRLYGSAITTDTAAGEGYHWYTDQNNQMIGIEKAKLSQQETALLDLLLTPVPTDDLHITPEERIWQQLLFQQDPSAAIPGGIKHVRFLHFSLKEPFFEKRSLEEALRGLLEAKFIIVWRDHTDGVIIETYPYSEEEHLLDRDAFTTLTSDFFVTPHVLIGRFLPADTDLLEAYRREQLCFQIGKKYMRKQHMYMLDETLPFLFMEEDAREAADFLLRHVKEEQDLLTTVRVYLECNMNVSLAAKQLYMHRNSVLYRVDKFIERTGIDIKTFQGAVSVYMALLLLDA